MEVMNSVTDPIGPAGTFVMRIPLPDGRFFKIQGGLSNYIGGDSRLNINYPQPFTSYVTGALCRNNFTANWSDNIELYNTFCVLHNNGEGGGSRGGSMWWIVMGI